jgi:hypothetical protein
LRAAAVGGGAYYMGKRRAEALLRRDPGVFGWFPSGWVVHSGVITYKKYVFAAGDCA